MQKTIILAGAAAVLLTGVRLAKADEWSAYGRDLQGTRFSPLTQVTPANVASLKPAWTFHTGDISTGKLKGGGPRSGFETTPLMMDGRLYLTTPFNRVIALDPATGKQLWAYDPKLDRDKPYGDGLINRGSPGGVIRRLRRAASARFGFTRRRSMRGWSRWTRQRGSPAPASARTARLACATSPATGPASTT